MVTLFGLSGQVKQFIRPPIRWRNELQPKQPLDLAGELKAAVLGLYGGADQSIPAEQIEKMTIGDGVISVWEVGGKEGWFVNAGIHQFLYADLGNARFFMFALEKLLGGERGSLADLGERFTQAGLPLIMDSWTGRGPKFPITAADLRRVLGEERVSLFYCR